MKEKLILFLGLFLIIIIPSSYAINTPRPEYPRPQFERAEWINLNGTWSYTFDFSQSGMERSLYNSEGFEQSIIVPFCPESSLSGVGYKDFINAMWYQRKISIPARWEGKRILLNFGGVDYKSIVFINGQQAFIHYGGSSSFSVDITPYVKPGYTSNLVVYVEDDLRQGLQTAGKQSLRLNSYSCHYTRVTGIWQTVWLEPVATQYITNLKTTPDIDNNSVKVEVAANTTSADKALPYVGIECRDGTRMEVGCCGRNNRYTGRLDR